METLRHDDRHNFHEVPEGYFEDLRVRLSSIPQGSGHAVRERSGRLDLTPYLALAACFAILFVVGTAILRSTGSRMESAGSWDADEEVYADLASADQPYMMWQEYDTTEEDVMDDEDIIDYLIESGVSAEVLEMMENQMLK